MAGSGCLSLAGGRRRIATALASSSSISMAAAVATSKSLAVKCMCVSTPHQGSRGAYSTILRQSTAAAQQLHQQQQQQQQPHMPGTRALHGSAVGAPAGAEAAAAADVAEAAAPAAAAAGFQMQARAAAGRSDLSLANLPYGLRFGGSPFMLCRQIWTQTWAAAASHPFGSHPSQGQPGNPDQNSSESEGASASESENTSAGPGMGQEVREPLPSPGSVAGEDPREVFRGSSTVLSSSSSSSSSPPPPPSGDSHAVDRPSLFDEVSTMDMFRLKRRQKQHDQGLPRAVPAAERAGAGEEGAEVDEEAERNNVGYEDEPPGDWGPGGFQEASASGSLSRSGYSTGSVEAAHQMLGSVRDLPLEHRMSGPEGEEGGDGEGQGGLQGLDRGGLSQRRKKRGALWALGCTVVVHVASEETEGKYAAMEYALAPGEGSQVHVHEKMQEAWIVLEGSLQWQIGDRTTKAVAGDVLHLPAGQPHGFRNPSDSPSPARMLAICVPGGLEKYFEEVGVPALDDPSAVKPAISPQQAEAAVALGMKYGLRYTKGVYL